MERMVNGLFITFMFLFLNTTSAQNKPDARRIQFSDQVVVRVAEIASITKMPPARQLLLARFYAKKDSLVLTELKSGKDPQNLVAVFDELNKEFELLLTPDERTKYSLHMSDSYLRREASETARYFSERYNTKGGLKQWFDEIVLDKNLNLARFFASNQKDSKSSMVKIILQRYDSLMTIYKVAAKGEDYLNRMLKSIDSIKPMENQKKHNISEHFTWLCLRRGDNYLMNFRTALQMTTNERTYFDLLAGDSAEHELQKKDKVELNGLAYKYALPDSILKKIEPIVASKNRSIYDIELRYPYGQVRDSLLREIQELSWFDIKRILIRAGRYRLGNSRFVYAMAYKNVLKLSEAQLDSLAHRNYQLDIQAYQYSLVDPWGENHGSAFVQFQLQKILRPGQYDTLLQLESSPKAIIETKKNWEQLKRLRLVSEKDSLSVVHELFNYHLTVISIGRRYAGNTPVLQRLTKQASDMKPPLLRKLEAAIKASGYETADLQAFN